MKPPLVRNRKWLAAGLFTAVMWSVYGAWIFGSIYCTACNHIVALPKDLPVERVAFSSKSGATIRGWIVSGETNRGVVILQHGIHGDKSMLVGRAKLVSQAGYTVLLFDFQAHGESIGDEITFGYLESLDSQAAVEFVKKRFPGKPVAIIGVSLGAAAAVLAKPSLDVQALVLEMMYPTIEDATKDRIEIRLGAFGRCLSPLLTAQIPWHAGCSEKDLRPIDAVADILTPKLFIAGTADLNTKFSEAERIFANAAGPKNFVAVDGARHQDLFRYAPEQYRTNVLDFLDKYLK
jgi:alpha-beta hydrolase superfamily lysophospholipase